MLTVHLINPLEHKRAVLNLLQQLNPEMAFSLIEERLTSMVESNNYLCFGLFEDERLIGLCSGWSTVRIYCGKQLELDNVIVDQSLQSKGLGTFFMQALKQWTVENSYQSIGLNTYVTNSQSHKFYLNQGFTILGFHFEHFLQS
ncbi:GNAT family N-acetyltransferase [Marinicella meishanensis]|uniref:GNAT family N-acetyltransferase n=1 Tax=Marinicella meishanensis TaxID=2873263 RepID=UPI001CBE021B|nr:GNAT family N-acetyltransferase [Marinicella sp. NBU2979]